VRISDAAIVAAVNLSHRYIPARQLPDKAVSLLDTAAARVAISQSATPALVEDARVAIVAREAERAALVCDGDLGVDDTDRITTLDVDIAALREKLSGLEAEWATEQTLVNDIRGIREILAEPKQGDDETKAKRAELRGKFDTLEGITPEKRMIYAHVDEQSVASVVSDWTGIPVGRMVRDEIETVLKLPEILNRRVVGQSHGLAMIAKRIETSRAKLDNPSKPMRSMAASRT
jgi:type VI secretion system protein VasG